MTSQHALALPATVARRAVTGFWVVAFAFLVVMAFATLPSPLYALYRARDHLSAFTITIVYAIFAGGVIAALVAVPAIAARIGRRGVMLTAVATMMASAGLLAAWKALRGLLLGRLLTGVAVGLVAGTATTYLIELRVRQDPNGSIARARNVGTAVGGGAPGRGALVAGCLAQWARGPLTVPYLLFVALGALALIALAGAPETGGAAGGQATSSLRSARVPVPGAAAHLAG